MVTLGASLLSALFVSPSEPFPHFVGVIVSIRHGRERAS